ncbi:hypothetical protein AJ90_19895 [Vibrio parahaemolyticus M0605]|nr:hypothetical protein AJ90_19895 [Vibrio parahaemolyticus M0605]
MGLFFILLTQYIVAYLTKSTTCKTLILINKDRLADKNKSILLVLISVAKKTVKIAKLELNLLAFLGCLIE